MGSILHSHQWTKNTTSSKSNRILREEQDALEFEHVMLEKCCLALERIPIADSKDEANLLHVIAKMIQAEYSDVADRLTQASVAYFSRSTNEPMSLEQVVAAKLVPSLPRFRALFIGRLKAKNGI